MKALRLSLRFVALAAVLGPAFFLPPLRSLCGELVAKVAAVALSATSDASLSGSEDFRRMETRIGCSPSSHSSVGTSISKVSSFWMVSQSSFDIWRFSVRSTRGSKISGQP